VGGMLLLLWGARVSRPPRSLVPPHSLVQTPRNQEFAKLTIRILEHPDPNSAFPLQVDLEV
jgi:hypothetical protein